MINSTPLFFHAPAHGSTDTQDYNTTPVPTRVSPRCAPYHYVTSYPTKSHVGSRDTIGVTGLVASRYPY